MVKITIVSVADSGAWAAWPAQKRSMKGSAELWLSCDTEQRPGVPTQLDELLPARPEVSEEPESFGSHRRSWFSSGGPCLPSMQAQAFKG